MSVPDVKERSPPVHVVLVCPVRNPFHRGITPYCKVTLKKWGWGSSVAKLLVGGLLSNTSKILCWRHCKFAYLSLATSELDVHETAGVLEPLHGAALTVISKLVFLCSFGASILTAFRDRGSSRVLKAWAMYHLANVRQLLLLCNHQFCQQVCPIAINTG